MNPFERFWLSVLIIASTCYGCARPHIPMVLRPDTRRIAAVQIDSATLVTILDVFHAAFPNEAALCLLGFVADTTLDGDRWLVVRVTGAVPAQADSADQYHVFFSHFPRTGCAGAGLVGAAHDHTLATPTCDHSYPDANVLFEDTRLLFSVVFCADGWSQALYADGRRVLARWMPEP